MKVLITGHQGFVGRHFQKLLESEGHEVIGWDIKSGVDCRDMFKKDKTVYDVVIHLAAIVGGRETIEGNPIAVATDLSIDAEMFNWAVNTKQKKIIYYSSSAAYPIKLQETPYKLKESDIDLENVSNPDFSYGWAKLTGELLSSYARQQGIDVYVFRPFSGFGEDQDLTYPFPSFIKRIADKEDPFTIWGDGNQVRDFIHIDDVVAATWKAVELNIQKPVNLGNGRATSFNELAEICFKVAGVKPRPIKHLIDKPIGVDYRCSDNSFMLTFYKPKIKLEDGIKKALEHYSSK
jgi:nucleoside-diphosphate-sugar epimerase